jgi:hypothetical protein
MSEFDEIYNRLDRIDDAIEGLTLHGRAQTALAERQLEDLKYLETLVQICIDQGKDFNVAIGRTNRRIDELEEQDQ